MSLEKSHVPFPSTQWTLVEALALPNHPERSSALQSLITCYWPPVYAYLRRQGRDREAAAELTQAFFAEVVVGRRLFDRADQQRGRLRTLMLTAVQRYVTDVNRRQTSRGKDLTISMDDLEHEEQFLTADEDEDVAAVYDRRWAMAVVEEALQRCERYLRAAGLDRHWAAFEAHALQPALTMRPAPSLADLAEQFGFEGPEKVSTALRTVRKRMLVVLREVAAQTARTPEEQDQEYEFLVSLLS